MFLSTSVAVIYIINSYLFPIPFLHNLTPNLHFHLPSKHPYFYPIFSLMPVYLPDIPFHSHQRGDLFFRKWNDIPPRQLA